MKKVMFIIVGMLFAVTVNAATLTLVGGTGSTGNDLSVDSRTNPGNSVTGSTNTLGDFTDVWSISTDVDTVVNFSVDGLLGSDPLNNTSPVTSVTLSGGNLLSSVSFLGPVDFNIFTLTHLLTAGYDYAITVIGSGPSGYVLTAETPIPAALFLFAPALLGFFGLRRKAAVAA